MIRIGDQHTAVHQLVSHGTTISAVIRKLDLDRKSVRCFARAYDVDGLLITTRMAGPIRSTSTNPT
ncbi:putative transposase for insertion sequence element [Rhodococcus ruber BKS 20-38]|uniref:Putative transposase for insertion sequence element n=1 Tax=Rhodococcus ruber BKS 20-38 TaxID=1278076 RepID=M2YZ68_9NOCA|nr:putative transposase for insertion sequence element [Rhodococcus ruber BKS 20-38]